VPLFVDLMWSAAAIAFARLAVAIVLGGAIGLEREIHGCYAGVRTHMLVTLGAAGFVLLGVDIANGSGEAVARTLQGVLIGVGFLGSGTIIKGEPARRIRGLTTASGVWCAAAVGAAVGAGYLVLAGTLTVVALAVLWLLGSLEQRETRRRRPTET
jgi:putative Mg2+ transporter-C (MgtC) family protein